MTQSMHTVRSYDENLQHLRSMVLTLGGLVENAIGDAMRALLRHDAALARRTIDRDRVINALEMQCDTLTCGLIARRQPAAGDLRLIVMAIKVVTDLERMGDLAAGICEGVLFLDKMSLQPRVNLVAMSELVRSQVTDALDALAKSDIDAALAVIEKDSVIDEMYQGCYRELLTYMLESPSRISGYIILSNIAKNLERIGDHATNICEMVIYMVRGHDIRHVDHETATALLKGQGGDMAPGAAAQAAG